MDGRDEGDTVIDKAAVLDSGIINIMAQAVVVVTAGISQDRADGGFDIVRRRCVFTLR